jgi:hypothetical protein
MRVKVLAMLVAAFAAHSSIAAEREGASFRREVVAALSVGGCSMGACHGSPSGKGGFKLSLRGQDPAFDYAQLVRELGGRRVSIADPSSSLLFLKATGQVAHEGGMRFGMRSVPGKTLLAWMASGCADDGAAEPKSFRLEVKNGTLDQAVTEAKAFAEFDDAPRRDVTPLTVFASSDPNVADVDGTGKVEFKKPGEVAIIARYMNSLSVAQLAFIPPPPSFVWKEPAANNRIDEWAAPKWKAMHLLPSEVCSDSEFIRRVTLDLCGRLPTIAETTEFLADTTAGKRDRVIDRLLQDSAHVDLWTMKWFDVLKATRRNLGETGLVAYRQWLHGHIEKNTPFDQVVREMIIAKGDTYKVGPANFHRVARTPDDAAEMASQLFLGVRLQCAKCHNHPYERWTQNDYYGFAAFFARVARKPGAKVEKKQEASEVIVSEAKGETTNPRTGETMAPRFLGGIAPGDANGERREALAAWLTSQKNPYFAKSIVNRVWYHLMGRGIVEPVDDFRESNPPSHPELLEHLSQEFAADYDVRKLIRTIVQSRTYQLSVTPNATNREDTRYFSVAHPRMLTAEQAYEAMCEVTEIREKLPGGPDVKRITAVIDTDAIDRSARAFLKSFNQPAREMACECERPSEGNLAQALQVLNGAALHDRLSSSTNRLGRLLTAKTGDEAIVRELYLAALAREPRDDEKQAALAYVSKASERRKAWEDVLWAVMTSREFILRH